MTIIAAADGSALGNPGPAGWAWYIDENAWHAGGWKHGTNNMGELMAVLDLLNSTESVREQPLQILCDSQYVINCLTKWMKGWKKKGWKKADGKPVLNQDLLKELDAALAGRDVTFEWVKGHAGHPLNEAADTRANGAAKAYQAGKAPQAGPGFTKMPDGVTPGTATTAPGRGEAPTGDEASGMGPVDMALTLEAEVMDAIENGDRSTLKVLLSPQFRGVSHRGELVNAALVVDAESGRPVADGVERLLEEAVSSSVVQLAYRIHRGDSSSVVTSWWRREDAAWKCFFRQETPES
ncbi:RNase H family protein [Galactobacter sp.]|uniref:RNase H family protein n=1 Tax=Galactobacter sp. TaxID=2676125 RepID=UPI0025BA3AE8|nr:RNase H family protein [Galactobacter sp.]